jgi:hypothetical protein
MNGMFEVLTVPGSRPEAPKSLCLKPWKRPALNERACMGLALSFEKAMDCPRVHFGVAEAAWSSVWPGSPDK